MVLLVAWWPRLTGALRGIAAAGAVVAGAGLLFVVVGANTGLTGRTSIWPAYLELWAGSPVWGAGEAGIGEAQREGLLPAWAYHAHSLWLDVLARYGAVAFVAVGVVLASAVVVAVGGMRRGEPAAAGVVTVVLVSSIAHTLIDWRLPDVPLLVLVLAVLSVQAGRPLPAGSSQPSSAESGRA